MSDLMEFYCASSGGGCGGYITVPVNPNLNGVIEVVCPKCGHKHRRSLKNGVLGEDGRYKSDPIEQLCPTDAAWHKKAQSPESQRRTGGIKEREAVVIKQNDAQSFLDERKFELWGGKNSD